MKFISYSYLLSFSFYLYKKSCLSIDEICKVREYFRKTGLLPLYNLDEVLLEYPSVFKKLPDDSLCCLVDEPYLISHFIAYMRNSDIRAICDEFNKNSGK